MAKNSKRREKEENSGGGSFIVLFTALSTILLSLFIMMNAQSTRDEVRVKEVWGAIRANFGVLEGGLRFTPGKNFMPPGPPILMDGVNDWTDSVLYTDMVGLFSEEAQEKGVVTYFDRDELVVSFPSDVLFQPETQDFRPQARRLLRMIAHIIRRTRNTVEIGGHADDARPPATHWDLSVSRALAVSEWITKKGRVVPGRLRAVAFAEHQPPTGVRSLPIPAATRRVSIRFRKKEDAQLMPFSGAFGFRGFLFKVRSLVGGQ